MLLSRDESISRRNDAEETIPASNAANCGATSRNCAGNIKMKQNDKQTAVKNEVVVKNPVMTISLLHLALEHIDALKWGEAYQQRARYLVQHVIEDAHEANKAEAERLVEKFVGDLANAIGLFQVATVERLLNDLGMQANRLRQPPIALQANPETEIKKLIANGYTGEDASNIVVSSTPDWTAANLIAQ
jgi:hypothetical protein